MSRATYRIFYRDKGGEVQYSIFPRVSITNILTHLESYKETYSDVSLEKASWLSVNPANLVDELKAMLQL